MFFSLNVRNIVTLSEGFNLSQIVQVYCFCCDVNMDISYVKLLIQYFYSYIYLVKFISELFPICIP